MAGLPVVVDWLRDAAYAGVDGAGWVLKRLRTGETVASGTTATDATASPPLAGRITVDETGLVSPYPGPVKLTASDPLSGAVRIATSESVGIVGSWRAIDVPRAWRGLGSGVIPGVLAELAVTTTGVNMDVGIAAGSVVIPCGQDALLYAVPQAQAITATPAHPSLGRIDSVALRVYPPGHGQEGRIDLVLVAGAPNAVPAPPALAQGEAGLWEYRLADVTVDAAVTSLAAGKVTDRREFLAVAPGGRTAGDLFVIDAARKLARLPVGATGKVLVVAAGAPVWGTVDGGSISGQIPAVRVGTGTVNDTEFGYLNGVTSALQAQIAGKQPLDSDLTTIAGLSPSANDLLQFKAGAWAARSPSQLKTDLALTKADVGLSNVDNTSDATKNAATATLLNKTLVAPTITGTLDAQGDIEIANGNDLRLKDLGGTTQMTLEGGSGVLYFGPVAASTVSLRSGTAPPEGNVSAAVGSWYFRSTGNAYQKMTGGTGNTGWVTNS